MADQAIRRLTAATVPDVDRRESYLGYLLRHPTEEARMRLDMSRRVRIRVLDGSNRPVHDAGITLTTRRGQVLGRTHADGWWDFYPGVSAPDAGGDVTVHIDVDGVAARTTIGVPAEGDGRDVVIRLRQAITRRPHALDLAFLIDATGSMGDEIEYVTEEVVGLVERIEAAVPQVSIRVGAVLYRDRFDRVPLEMIPFTEDVRAFNDLMRLVHAEGGGDYPEDMHGGLAAAMSVLDWRRTPTVRVLVLIADAPPKEYAQAPYTHVHAMVDATAMGVRILPVAASGANRLVEYLFRSMGAFTSTPYVYLTDDSGVGDHHMDADTDRIAVEMFSDLLTRLVVSDLHGLGMHEPR